MKTKHITIACLLAITVGALLGFYGRDGFFSISGQENDRQPGPRGRQESERPSLSLDPSPSVSALGIATLAREDQDGTAAQPDTQTLTERLEQEEAERRRLEKRLQALSVQVARLERLLENKTGRPSESEPSERAAAGRESERERSAKRTEEERFLAVGFTPDQTVQLKQRMGEIEMERLYLRDRAAREGWLRTPEYRQAAGELRNQLRNEMGEDVYDRLLFATGRNNRVIVDSIIDSSPAQQIGLEPGDVIHSYDGSRVFRHRDLRTISRAGDAGSFVPITVERNGEVLELEIQRGPLGVRLDATSVEP